MPRFKRLQVKCYGCSEYDACEICHMRQVKVHLTLSTRLIKSTLKGDYKAGGVHTVMGHGI